MPQQACSDDQHAAEYLYLPTNLAAGNRLQNCASRGALGSLATSGAQMSPAPENLDLLPTAAFNPDSLPVATTAFR